MICLIVFIFSIAGVSAMDVNQAIDDAGGSVSSADTLGVSLSNDEVVGSADNGTSEDFQKKIDDADEGSTINLENNYTFGGDVHIDKAITIDGNGYTIGGSGYNYIFSIKRRQCYIKKYQDY